MTEREKNGERLALQMSRHRQAKNESLKDEDVKTAYIKGCEDTARAMLAHSIADIQNARKEARKIIREYYDRSKDYPTCDNKLNDLRRRALAWLEGEK